MKKIITTILGCLMLASLATLASCSVGGGTPNTSVEQSASQGTTQNGGLKEGTVADIKSENVVKIVTDEIDLPEGSMYRTDYASPSYHAIYDFSKSAEIKNYDCVYKTDPNAYETTNRIMVSTNCDPVWSSDRTTVTVSRKYGIAMNAEDILNDLSKKSNPFTAYMKDGSAIHVRF